MQYFYAASKLARNERRALAEQEEKEKEAQRVQAAQLAEQMDIYQYMFVEIKSYVSLICVHGIFSQLIILSFENDYIIYLMSTATF